MTRSTIRTRDHTVPHSQCGLLSLCCRGAVRLSPTTTRLDATICGATSVRETRSSSSDRRESSHAADRRRATSLGQRATTLMSEFENVKRPVCRFTSTLMIFIPTHSSTNGRLCPHASNSRPAVTLLRSFSMVPLLICCDLFLLRKMSKDQNLDIIKLIKPLLLNTLCIIIYK